MEQLHLTEYESDGVGDCETEQVVVSGGVHMGVPGDDDTRGQVADHTCDEDDGVDDAESQQLGVTAVPGAQVSLQVDGLRERRVIVVHDDLLPSTDRRQRVTKPSICVLEYYFFKIQ